MLFAGLPIAGLAIIGFVMSSSHGVDAFLGKICAISAFAIVILSIVQLSHPKFTLVYILSLIPVPLIYLLSYFNLF